MAKSKELPKELFDFDYKMKHALREYSFTDCDGKTLSVNLGENAHLIKKRCPLDGAYLVLYSKEPHNEVECPCCLQDFSEAYTTKNYAKDLRRRIAKMKGELTRSQQILAIVDDKNHPVRRANQRNLRSVKELSDMA
jgi:hypothetical protein